ncbi:ladderlectin-like [Poeciliopsis prolifica]|nr:ladderlectin-like [Poeciliopsis prolifica]
MIWPEAEINCQAMGATLASIYSMYYYGEVQKLIREKTGRDERAWLGGCNAEKEGSWWWRGDCPVSFTNWCRGEPNNGGGNQHCMQMNFSDEKCWDDVECHYKLPSVCIKKRRQ